MHKKIANRERKNKKLAWCVWNWKKKTRKNKKKKQKKRVDEKIEKWSEVKWIEEIFSSLPILNISFKIIKFIIKLFFSICGA